MSLHVSSPCVASPGVAVSSVQASQTGAVRAVGPITLIHTGLVGGVPLR
jgi:hypothetical protein